MRVLTARLAPLVLTAALLLAACEGGVSQENFDRIEVGMSYDSVKRILGSGELQDGAGFGIGATGIGQGSGDRSQNRKVYLWNDAGRQISITFVDGKVSDKNKFGF